MFLTIKEQFDILVYSLIFGAVLGFFSIVYKWLIRGVTNKILKIFTDFIATTAAAGAFFLFVLLLCKGQIRVYELLSVLSGFVLCLLVFYDFFKPFLIYVLKLIRGREKSTKKLSIRNKS